MRSYESENNKLTFQTEGAVSSLKSNYIKNENNCPKEGGHHNHHRLTYANLGNPQMFCTF